MISPASNPSYREWAAKKAMGLLHLRETLMQSDLRQLQRMGHAKYAKHSGLDMPEEEVIHVGDVTVNIAGGQDATASAGAAGGSGGVTKPKSPIVAEALKPIGKLAKAGLVAAAMTGVGGIGAAAVGLWEAYQSYQTQTPAAADTDTDTTTQYDLELVPNAD